MCFYDRWGDGFDGVSGFSGELRSLLQHESPVPKYVHETGQEDAPAAEAGKGAPHSSQSVALSVCGHVYGLGRLSVKCKSLSESLF